MRPLGGCIGRLLLLVVAVGVVTFAWYNRHELSSAWDRLTGGEVEVSPEIAARADEKLTSLGTPGGPTRVALGGSELQSLIEYRWGGFLPQDVVDPRVSLADNQVTLEAGVATARFDRLRDLREIVAFLPDTAALRAVGSFVPLDSGHVGLEIHELMAAGIPIPKRLIPTVLGNFRRPSVQGLPANAVAVPLPPGVRSVSVSGDSMVFQANPSGGE